MENPSLVDGLTSTFHDLTLLISDWVLLTDWIGVGGNAPTPTFFREVYLLSYKAREMII